MNGYWSYYAILHSVERMALSTKKERINTTRLVPRFDSLWSKISGEINQNFALCCL